VIEPGKHYRIIALADYIFYLYKMPLMMSDQKAEHIAHFKFNKRRNGYRK
jgi:hypothetical protein